MLIKNFDRTYAFLQLNNKRIEDYAKENNSEEICGIWLTNGDIKFFHNFSNTPFNNFTFTNSTWDYIKKDADVQGIFYSHIGDAPCHLSLEDINLAHTLNLDITCYHIERASWDYFSPLIPHPYHLKQLSKQKPYTFYTKHRAYFPGRSDCYSLVIDWYLQEYDIVLPYVTRSHNDFGESRPRQWNRFIHEYADNGWMPSTTLDIGSVVLFKIENDTPNHVGVIWDNKPVYRLLHLLNKRAEIINLEDYRANIVSVFNHVQLQKQQP